MSAWQRPFGVAWPLLLVIAGLAMPPEASLNLGGLRLSAYRVVLILTLLPCLFLLFTGRRGRLNLTDGLIVLHCAWVLLALVRQAGLGQGIESGGIYVVECLGAFLLGRLFIRSYEDFYRFTKVLVGLTLLLLLFTVPEALTGKHFIRDFFRAFLGGPGAHYIDPRMGLNRAFGPFDHPILYGVFSAAGFSLCVYVLAQARLYPIKRLLPAAGVALATFLSLSGGPFVALAMQIMIIAWERLTAGIRFRWLALAGIFACVYIAISLLSNRNPLLVFISYLTFSTRSAYNRVLIWEYGTAEVARHPVFGIGLADWVRAPWMSDSMDNFWLVTAVRYGLPAFAMLAIALCLLVMRVASRKDCPPEILMARRAWGFTLFGLALAGCTVHLWNALFVLFFLILGSGCWILEFSRKPAALRVPQAMSRVSPEALSPMGLNPRPATFF